VVSFNLDHLSNKLLILSKVRSSRGATLKMLWMFKIFDLESKDILYETSLDNENVIGRLKSGLFTLVNGHMYYSNNVIKIRYDLLQSHKNIQFKED
jgi:hypothetical protein